MLCKFEWGVGKLYILAINKLLNILCYVYQISCFFIFTIKIEKGILLPMPGQAIIWKTLSTR